MPRKIRDHDFVVDEIESQADRKVQRRRGAHDRSQRSDVTGRGSREECDAAEIDVSDAELVVHRIDRQAFGSAQPRGSSRNAPRRRDVAIGRAGVDGDGAGGEVPTKISLFTTSTASPDGLTSPVAAPEIVRSGGRFHWRFGSRP